MKATSAELTLDLCADLVGVHGPNAGAHNLAVTIHEQGGGEHQYFLAAHVVHLRIAHDVVGNTDFLHVLRGHVEGVATVDSDDRHLRADLMRNLLKGRHLLPTRGAVSLPEVHHERLASVMVQ